MNTSFREDFSIKPFFGNFDKPFNKSWIDEEVASFDADCISDYNLESWLKNFEMPYKVHHFSGGMFRADQPYDANKFGIAGYCVIKNDIVVGYYIHSQN